MHLIVPSGSERCVEVQIRTPEQNAWAILCEEAAATFGMDVKYGGGPAGIQTVLMTLSDIVGSHRHDAPSGEVVDKAMPGLRSELRRLVAEHSVPPGAANLLYQRLDRLGTLLSLWSGSA